MKIKKTICHRERRGHRENLRAIPPFGCTKTAQRASVWWRAPCGQKGRLGGIFKKMRLAVLLIYAYPFAVQAETLGRLFHTPEQRALLDLARKSTPVNANGEADQATGQGLSVSGVVTRSDGKRSTWINGRVEHDAATAHKQDRSQVWVKLPGGEVKLKVGQSLDPATGQVAEGYRRPNPPEPATAKPEPPKAPAKTLAPAARDDNAEPDQAPAQ